MHLIFVPAWTGHQKLFAQGAPGGAALSMGRAASAALHLIVTPHPVHGSTPNGVGVRSRKRRLREHRALRNQIIFQIAPHRYHQLAGEGDDADPA